MPCLHDVRGVCAFSDARCGRVGRRYVGRKADATHRYDVLGRLGVDGEYERRHALGRGAKGPGVIGRRGSEDAG